MTSAAARPPLRRSLPALKAWRTSFQTVSNRMSAREASLNTVPQYCPSMGLNANMPHVPLPKLSQTWAGALFPMEPLDMDSTWKRHGSLTPSLKPSSPSSPATCRRRPLPSVRSDRSVAKRARQVPYMVSTMVHIWVGWGCSERACSGGSDGCDAGMGG